jgi:hypothetical protein
MTFFRPFAPETGKMRRHTGVLLPPFVAAAPVLSGYPGQDLPVLEFLTKEVPRSGQRKYCRMIGILFLLRFSLHVRWFGY